MNERKPGDFPSKEATPLQKLLDPRNDPAEMSYEDAEAELSNAVYKATALLEHLEGAKLVRGNGHHMRQKIAEFAINLLKERWEEPK